MRQDGILKALQGYVTLEEVVKATEDAQKQEVRPANSTPAVKIH